MIKNQVAILDKIDETAWAVVDEDGWVKGGFFPSRAKARAASKAVWTLGYRTKKVKLVLA